MAHGRAARSCDPAELRAPAHQRQRVVPALADRHSVRADVWRAGDGRPNKPMKLTFGCGARRLSASRLGRSAVISRMTA